MTRWAGECIYSILMAVNFETDTAIQHYLDTALVSGFTCLARILDIAFYNVFVFTIRQYLFVTLNTDLVHNRDQFYYLPISQTLSPLWVVGQSSDIIFLYMAWEWDL